MANPSFVKSVNVRGDLYDCVVLKEDVNHYWLINYEWLDGHSKAHIKDFIDDYGGNVPMASPVSGWQVVDYNKKVDASTVIPKSIVPYKLKINIDWTIYDITINGDIFKNVGEFVTMFNANYPAVISYSNDGLRIVSKKTGLTSIIRIIEETVFSAIASYKLTHALVGASDLYEAAQNYVLHNDVEFTKWYNIQQVDKTDNVTTNSGSNTPTTPTTPTTPSTGGLSDVQVRQVTFDDGVITKIGNVVVPTKVLDVNTDRRGFIIYNGSDSSSNGRGQLYVSLVKNVNDSSVYSILLKAGGSYEHIPLTNTYSGPIWLWFDKSDVNNSAMITEFTP